MLVQNDCVVITVYEHEDNYEAIVEYLEGICQSVEIQNGGYVFITDEATLNRHGWTSS